MGKRELSKATDAMKRTLSSRLAAAGAALASAVASSGAQAELKPGDVAPVFTAPAALAGQVFEFSLQDALAHGPVVVYFYPKAFTRGCTIEANRFAEAQDEYRALYATVIGLSGDDIETLKKFSVAECRDRFAVASDADGSIMKAYGAAMPLLSSYAKRVSYVIGTDGRIAYAYSSMSPDEHVPNTLAALRALAKR